MVLRLKESALKLALAFALAAMASLFAATAAFASPNVNVTFPVESTTATENVDLSTISNSAAAPVAGMYYKSSAWNVLVTGTAAGQYATVEKVLQTAVSQYNEDNGTSVAVSDFWNASTTNKMTFITTDYPKGYDKYYPTYADTNTRQYFYNLAGNSNLAFSSALRSSSITLLTGVTLSNPNGIGGVLAWQYGQNASGTNAGASAQSAAAAVSTYSNPRFITGCDDTMTSSNAMGKRYCMDITGITIG